ARGIALPQPGDQRLHPVEDRLVDLLVGVYALDRDAHLPAVGEAAPHDGVRGALDVAVLARHERRLAAELHRARDEPLPARGGDLAPGLHGAGEHAEVDPGVDERLTRGAEAD